MSDRLHNIAVRGRAGCILAGIAAFGLVHSSQVKQFVVLSRGRIVLFFTVFFLGLPALPRRTFLCSAASIASLEPSRIGHSEPGKVLEAGVGPQLGITQGLVPDLAGSFPGLSAELGNHEIKGVIGKIPELICTPPLSR
jgi:hypothetical protein